MGGWRAREGAFGRAREIFWEGQGKGLEEPNFNHGLIAREGVWKSQRERESLGEQGKLVGETKKMLTLG